MVKPHYKKVAAELDGKITFAEADMETADDVGQELKIKGMPTFIGYKNGKEILRFSGYKNKDALQKEIEKLLN